MVKGASSWSTSELLRNLCGYTLISVQLLMDESGRRGVLPDLTPMANWSARLGMTTNSTTSSTIPRMLWRIPQMMRVT